MTRAVMKLLICRVTLFGGNIIARYLVVQVAGVIKADLDHLPYQSADDEQDAAVHA